MPTARGRGVAKALLKRLEAEARDAGASLLRIETGVHQHDALRFYEDASFRRRQAFGPYVYDDDALLMVLLLVGREQVLKAKLLTGAADKLKEMLEMLIDLET